MAQTKEVLFKKEVMFHSETKEELVKEQAKVIGALEILGLTYDIKRTAQYGTGTPTWEINIYN